MTSEESELDFDALLRQRAAAAGAKSGAGSSELKPLADLTKSAQASEVDGLLFSQLVMAGTLHMIRNKQTLNKINVFPVADGDTGTNCVNCMKRPCRNLFSDPAADLRVATANLGADVLINGQGNSGTILSHFFISLAGVLKGSGSKAVSVEAFAKAVGVVGDMMQTAVANPKDGTMVSVARDSSKAAAAAGGAGLGSFLDAWSASATEELARTPEQLEVDGKFVLKEAGVVDSGAMAFANIVQGMALGVKGTLERAEDFTELKSGTLGGHDDEMPTVDHNVTDTKFRYCTEAVIMLTEGKSKADMETAVQAIVDADEADSMVCVGAPAKGGGDMVKVHVHTNTPAKIFAAATEFSKHGAKLLKEKVEDMYAEREAAHGEEQFDMSGAKFTVMVDGAWLGQEVLKHCALTPVWIMTENNPDAMLLGGPNENAMGLCNELRANPSKIFTAAPLPGQAKVAMQNALHAHPDREVLAINLGTPFTATPRNVQAAADALSDELKARVTCYDTMTLGENSLMAFEALRCAAKGMSAAEALERVKYVEERVYHCFFFSSESVKKMAEWGRAGDIKAEDVVDGMVFCMGSGVGRLPSHDRNPKLRAQHFMFPLQQADAGEDAMVKCQLAELEAIKAALKPGQVIRDLWIMVNIRTDLGVEFAERCAATLPCKEAPKVLEPTLVTALLLKYGEMSMQFWVDDA